MGEMLVSKTGENSVRLYFTVNYAESDENYVPIVVVEFILLKIQKERHQQN